jgi:hypothetical protein
VGVYHGLVLPAAAAHLWRVRHKWVLICFFNACFWVCFGLDTVFELFWVHFGIRLEYLLILGDLWRVRHNLCHNRSFYAVFRWTCGGLCFWTCGGFRWVACQSCQNSNVMVCTPKSIEGATDDDYDAVGRKQHIRS